MSPSVSAVARHGGAVLRGCLLRDAAAHGVVGGGGGGAMRHVRALAAPAVANAGSARASSSYSIDAAGGSSSMWETHESPPPLTPWVRQVISGVELLRNPRYNKGMSFTDDERDKMHLRGLLPPAKFTQNMQVKRVMRNVRALQSPVEQHFHLLGLQERNERLFYRVLQEHPEELLPIMYTPTIGKVCEKFSEVFNRPRGIYISSADRGNIYRVLKNWPEKHVRLVVVTDGERVMGLGDLGVQGMGVAAAKTNLYTSMGGVDPADALPVCIDVGTNNRALLNDPLYIGQKMERLTGDQYDDLLDEFVDAVKRRFGERCIVQFEDFSNANGKRLLERYATQACTFNDDIHGVAATTLAGIISAMPKTGKSVADHTYLIAGAGETGTGIGEMIAEYVAQEARITVVEARQKIWMVDSKGLVTRARAEKEEDLALHKLPWAHDGKPECDTVLEAVKAIKPTALIGVRRHRHSLQRGALAGPERTGEGVIVGDAGGISGEPPRLFTREVLEEMGNNAEAPLIFALSRPEGISECTAEQAYEATDGRCIFATGCPVVPFMSHGRTVAPRPSTSAYVFPGFATGLLLADANRVRGPMFIAAAEALASMVTEEDLAVGAVYPRIAEIREVAARVAGGVAASAYSLGLAKRGKAPTYEQLVMMAKKMMYTPAYRCYM